MMTSSLLDVQCMITFAEKCGAEDTSDRLKVQAIIVNNEDGREVIQCDLSLLVPALERQC